SFPNIPLRSREQPSLQILANCVGFGFWRQFRNCSIPKSDNKIQCPSRKDWFYRPCQISPDFHRKTRIGSKINVWAAKSNRFLNVPENNWDFRPDQRLPRST